MNKDITTILFENINPDRNGIGALRISEKGIQVSRQRNADNTDWVWIWVGTTTDQEENRMKNIDKYYEELMNARNHCGCYWQKNILGKKNCNGTLCVECGRQFLQWLKSEYKEPIKLTKFEYDLLKAYDSFPCGDKFKNMKLSMLYIVDELKKLGYFKKVDLEKTLSEVLENCEVIYQRGE